MQNQNNSLTFPDDIRAVEWIGSAADGYLKVMDQRDLPDHEHYIEVRSVDEVIMSIRDMLVRGAPAIGCTAAYGMVIAVRQSRPDQQDWQSRLQDFADALKLARPTAVNLRWAVDRIIAALDGAAASQALTLALDVALRIHADDISANLRMGELGAQCLGQSIGVLTHCNAGSLATGGHGTALGVIRAGWLNQSIDRVFANETRPWLQGARLTAWELGKSQIPVKLIVDSAAAALMQAGHVGCVIVGADRVAANGDVANKIGTYSLAVLARNHGLKFMVVAPTSTIDYEAPGGADIPIENRASDEVLNMGHKRVAAATAGAWNPVFDVTPAHLVDWLVTERGVISKPDTEALDGLRSGA